MFFAGCGIERFPGRAPALFEQGRIGFPGQGQAQIDNGPAFGSAEGFPGHLPALAVVQIADGVADDGNQVDAHGHGGGPQPHQQGQQGDVTRHFPADGRRDAFLVTGGNRHADDAHHGRVRGAEHVGYAVVDPVHGNCVLGQVVGSHGKEVHFLRKHVRHDGGAGDFNHDAHFQVPRVGDFFPFQFFPAFLEDVLGGDYFRIAGNHREHDAAAGRVRAGAQNGAELLLEQFRTAQGNADAPPAQEGVRFRSVEPFAGQLVASGIQRAEDDAVGGAAFRQFFVIVHLLFFIRHAGWIAQQEELRAEQPYAFCAHFLDAGVFVGEFHVDGEPDAAAVPGDGGQVPQGFQGLVRLFLLHLEPLVVFHGLRGGLEDEDALVAVQDGRSVAFHIQQRLFQPHHGGNAHGARKNGRMGNGGPYFRGESVNLAGVHRGGVGRCQVVRHEDFGLFLVRLVFLRRFRAAQVVDHPLHDVLHVRSMDRGEDPAPAFHRVFDRQKLRHHDDDSKRFSG